MTKRIGQFLQFYVSITLWGLVTVGTLTVVVLYFWLPTHRDDLKFTATVVAAAAAIYSAYFVGAGMRLRLERDKKDKCFEILSLLNRPEFVQVRQFIVSELRDHHKISPDDLYQKVLSDKELLNAITVALGIYEDAAIAIQCDYINEHILYQSLNFLVPWTFDCLKPYIDQLRAAEDCDVLYSELEKMAIAWKAGKSLIDGTKFPPL